jgi:hypothetical protein
MYILFLHPIFEMHLPEGYLLSIIKNFYKLIDTDDFGSLQVDCRASLAKTVDEAAGPPRRVLVLVAFWLKWAIKGYVDVACLGRGEFGYYATKACHHVCCYFFI